MPSSEADSYLLFLEDLPPHPADLSEYSSLTRVLVNVIVTILLERLSPLSSLESWPLHSISVDR